MSSRARRIPAAMTAAVSLLCDALVAEFGTAQIPLDRICKTYFSLNVAEAKRRANLNRLPVPAFRTASQKSQWFVSAEDLAIHIDRCREQARRDWQRSQLLGSAYKSPTDAENRISSY